MSARKTWIKIKRGILQPKHRIALGIRIWLYLHILDRADWDEGKVLEWRDEAEADLLEMPVDTLRKQRKQLEKDGYVTSIQGQYCQEIIIHKWVNPRKYDGKVLNHGSLTPPNVGVGESDDPDTGVSRVNHPSHEGSQNQPLSEVQGDHQGRHQGRHQGIEQLATPSIKLTGHSSHVIKDVDDESFAQMEFIKYFHELTKIPEPSSKSKPGRKERDEWWDAAIEALSMAGGDLERAKQLAKSAFEHCKEQELTLVGPKSLLKTMRSVAGGLTKGIPRSEGQEFLSELRGGE